MNEWVRVFFVRNWVVVSYGLKLAGTRLGRAAFFPSCMTMAVG